VDDPTGPIHPDDVPIAIEKWNANMPAGEAYEAELRFGGPMVNIAGSGATVPLFDEHGHIAKWYGTSTDIEDHKQAEEKLKRSESQLARHSGFRMSAIGSAYRRRRAICSEETYRIFGLPPQDAMRNLEQLIHRRIGRCMPRQLRERFVEELFDVEYRVVRRMAR